MKNTKKNNSELDPEDLRWAKMVRTNIVGLAAQAEMQCEGCDTAWLAIHYSLESLREVMDAIVDDFEERIGASKNEGVLANDR